MLAAIVAAGMFAPIRSLADTAQRVTLVKAVLSEDAADQQNLIKQLIGANDPVIEQALIAWRGGSLYLLETNNTKIPFLLEALTDTEGLAKGVRIADGEVFKEASGKPLLFSATDLTPADADSKLRKAIKTTLDLLALGNPNPKMRRDAVTKLGQEQNVDYLPHFESLQKSENDKEVVRALTEAVAITQLADDNAEIRNRAAAQLGEMRSINALTFLQKLETDAKADPIRRNSVKRRSRSRTSP